MAATKFSDYLGPKYYKKAKKLKHFIHLRLANWPQSFDTYHTISRTGNSGYQPKKTSSSYVMYVKVAFLR